MNSDLIKGFSRFIGLLILITLCSSTADLTKAEAVTPKIDTSTDSKFSCAIAKSAYGSSNFDEPVRRLRAFRDHVLVAFSVGRWLVKVYYPLSASLALLLDGGALSAGVLKWTVRAFLYLVKYLEAIGLGTGLGLIAFLLIRGTFKAIKPSPFSQRGSQPGT